jgi:hypothetical protein
MKRITLNLVIAIALLSGAGAAQAAFILPEPPNGAVIQAGPEGYADPTFIAYWDAGSDGTVGSRYGAPWLFISQYPDTEPSGKFPVRNWLTLGSLAEVPGPVPEIWAGRASGAFLLTPGTYYWQMEASTYTSYSSLTPPACCAYAYSPVWSFTVVPAPAAPPAAAPAASAPVTAARPASCTVQLANVSRAQRRVAAARKALRRASGVRARAKAQRALRVALKSRANANSALWRCQGLIK